MVLFITIILVLQTALLTFDLDSRLFRFSCLSFTRSVSHGRKFESEKFEILVKNSMFTVKGQSNHRIQKGLV